MTSWLGRLAKRVARALLGDYEAYVIFRLDRRDLPGTPGVGVLDSIDYRSAPTDLVQSNAARNMRDQAWYGGPGSLLFVALDRGTIVATLWCWYGSRYAQRGFIELEADQAKIVHVYTSEAARGRGVGSGLLRHACKELLGGRFESVLARVWVTNLPSRRMFAGCGFVPSRVIVILRPWPWTRSVRLELRSRFLLRRLATRAGKVTAS